MGSKAADMYTRSRYDNSLSYLYKQALKRNVPHRFILVNDPFGELKTAESLDPETIEHLEQLEKDGYKTFVTLFDVVRDLMTDDLYLHDVWDVISKFSGDPYNALELVFILIHANKALLKDERLVERTNAFLSEIKEPTVYESLLELKKKYTERWLPDYNKELEKDRAILAKYISFQRELESIPDVKSSDIYIDSVVMGYDYPTEPGVNPLPDVFNHAVTSHVVPFIQYNITSLKEDSNQVVRYYKIYKGRSVDDRPDYNSTALASGQTLRVQTIYLNVWTGLPSEPDLLETEAREGTKESFNIVTVAYMEKLSLVRVTVPSPRYQDFGEKDLIQRVHASLPSLPMPDTEITDEQVAETQRHGFRLEGVIPSREVKITGSFYIYNVDIVELALYDIITNDPLFSTYLYIEESTKSFVEKTRLNIHYRGVMVNQGEKKSGATVSAVLNQELFPKGSTIDIKGEGKKKLDADCPAISVKITRAISKRVAYDFHDILCKLFRRYTERRNVLDMYTKYVPDYVDVYKDKNRMRMRQAGKLGGSPIQALRLQAPDIFVSNYARKCQKSFQPRIISTDEVEEWKSKKVEVKGKDPEERQVLYFPKDTPRLALVCPSDDRPYPGVIKNKTLSNKNIYPYLPCCFKKDQTHSTVSEYYQYYHPDAKKIVVPKPSSNVIRTDKIAPPGRVGAIHTSISSLLSRDDDKYYRYGVPRDANSFIHCVLEAIGVEEYMLAKDKEAWVEEFRKSLFTDDRLYPELLKQELYDMPLDDIRARVTSGDDVFFDPLLYYRVLETIFDCTIFVFANKDTDQETRLRQSLLQVPRYKHYHVHPYRHTGRVILILRHWGSESDGLEYPQCELIIRDKPRTLLFDDSVGDIVHAAFTFVSRALTWEIQDDGVECRKQVYINYEEILGHLVISEQVLDSAGKARVLVLAPHESQRIFVCVPPTAPLNVPSLDLSGLGPVDQILPTYDQLVELFGHPSSGTATLDGEWVTGLWYAIGDTKYALYCPCQATVPYPEDLERDTTMITRVVQIPRESDEYSSPIQRIRTLHKAARHVEQILKYLYLLSDKGKDVGEFLRTVTVLNDDPDADSLSIYDPTSIPRILPKGDVSSVLESLARQCRTMFRDNKLVIYDKEMYTSIAYMLTRFAISVEGLDLSPSRYRQLEYYYSSKEDYQCNYAYEFILGTLKEYDEWSEVYMVSPNVQQRTVQNLKDNIQTQLNPRAYTYLEPYIYQRSGSTGVSSNYDPTKDKFYMVQNVAGGSFKRALQVAYNWYKYKKNTGFATDEWPSANAVEDGYDAPTKRPPYIVYNISPGGDVVLKQDASRGHDTYLEILNYTGEYYGAMLRIL